MNAPVPPPAEEECPGPPIKLLATCALVGFGLAWLLFRERPGSTALPAEAHEPDVEYLPPARDEPRGDRELGHELEDAEYEPA